MEDNTQEILGHYRTKMSMVAIHLAILFLSGGAMMVIPTIISDYLIIEISRNCLTILIVTVEVLLIFIIINSIKKAWKYLII